MVPLHPVPPGRGRQADQDAFRPRHPAPARETAVALSPLDAALGRIASASADGNGIHVLRRAEAGQGWVELDEFLDSDDLKAALLARVTGIGDPPPDHIKAEWMLESVSRALADLAGAFLLSSRILPDLSAGNLLIAGRNGLVMATAVRSEVVHADERWQTLADLIRSGLIELLRPIIEWMDGCGLRPAKTLWKASADRIAQSLDWSGAAFGERELALELTGYLMKPGEAMSVPVIRGEDEFGGSFHLRSTCCLAYRTPEGGLCRACPLNSAD